MLYFNESTATANTKTDMFSCEIFQKIYDLQNFDTYFNILPFLSVCFEKIVKILKYKLGPCISHMLFFIVFIIKQNSRTDTVFCILHKKSTIFQN